MSVLIRQGTGYRIESQRGAIHEFDREKTSLRSEFSRLSQRSIDNSGYFAGGATVLSQQAYCSMNLIYRFRQRLSFIRSFRYSLIYSTFFKFLLRLFLRNLAIFLSIFQYFFQRNNFLVATNCSIEFRNRLCSCFATITFVRSFHYSIIPLYRLPSL